MSSSSLSAKLLTDAQAFHTHKAQIGFGVKTDNLHLREALVMAQTSIATGTTNGLPLADHLLTHALKTTEVSIPLAYSGLRFKKI